MIHRNSRQFIRTFFTSPTAVDAADSAEMLRKASTLRGLQAPDVWVPDNEDATAPSMRDEGVENVIDVVSEHGSDFPGEIHPRVVWHRDDAAKRHQGFQHMYRMTDPEAGAVDAIDGFVIPEVGHIDDWKKADECFTIIENEHGLEEGSLRMSVIIESAQAELAMGQLIDEIGKPTNNLERLFLLVDGEVDYTKDMKAMTPTGQLPAWPELRHNTSRGASAVGLVAIDGPFDDIRNIEGYQQRMEENYAKGMLGIWALTPSQVELANTNPLSPQLGSYLLTVGENDVELERVSANQYRYTGEAISVSESDGVYHFSVGGDDVELDSDELETAVSDRLSYIPSLDDIVDSMEQFEEAKDAGRGAISLRREATIVIDDIDIDISRDRMWDEATYQAAQTPIHLLQEVWETRSDQRDELREMYGEDVIDRALRVG